MVKNKKPFINKKNASTYQLIHRSQRDVAPDHHENDTDSSSRMILWPKEDNIHSTTLPSTDRAVLMGVSEMEEEKEEIESNTEMINVVSNPAADTTTTTTSILSWKQQLQQMGVLDTVDHEEFLRPITGTGVFLDAHNGGRPVSTNSSCSNQRTPSVVSSSTKESAVAKSFVANDALLEVNRVMESLPLTTDCMDEEIAAILFAEENDGDDDDPNNNNDIFEDYEELNDDFIFMATGLIPIDEGNTDSNNNNNNSHSNVGAAQVATSNSFDFDAHIQQLINTAKLSRENDKKNSKANHPDEDFFAKHWQKPLKHINEDHDADDDNDDFSNDEDYRNITKDRYLSYANDDENSAMGGSSVYTSTTTFTTTGGTAKLLNPDEERALCDKFAATLAEYDNDSNDEYDDDNDEHQFGNINTKEENFNDENNDECRTIQSSSFQCATIGRPLVGDAVVEAALDEYLIEREDDIFIHGNPDRMRRKGGSGFAVLVGKQMINAKILDNATPIVQHSSSSAIPVEEMYPEQEPAIPIDEYIAIAQERLLQPKEKPPAEEIFIDGKSYYDERPRNPWDCESILSTYSNLDNNPITIGQSSTRSRRRKNMVKSKVDDNNSVVSSNHSESNNHQPNFTPQHIRLSTKTGLPTGVFDREHEPSNNNDEGDDDDDHENDTCMSVNKGVKRSKDETPEEKRIRKLMIKRERELARIQKKITKEIYNSEMQKHMPMISEDHMTGKTVFRFS